MVSTERSTFFGQMTISAILMTGTSTRAGINPVHKRPPISANEQETYKQHSKSACLLPHPRI